MAKRNGPRNFQDGPELGLRIWYLGRCDIFALSDFKGTLPETNISPEKAILKMIFLFQRWDMLVPWRVLGLFGHHQNWNQGRVDPQMNGSVGQQ